MATSLVCVCCACGVHACHMGSNYLSYLLQRVLVLLRRILSQNIVKIPNIQTYILPYRYFGPFEYDISYSPTALLLRYPKP